MAPDRWQSYARSARLFLALEKFDAAQTMINRALERLSRSEGETTTKREKLEELKTQVERGRRRKVKKAYHLGKLPVESIVMIFEELVADNPNQVLKVSRVCSQWRQIALSTPFLWQNLVLGSHKPREKARLWLEQSNNTIHSCAVGDRWGSLPPPKDFPWHGIRSFQVEGLSALSFRTFCENNGSPSLLSTLSFTCKNSGLPGKDDEAKAYWLPILPPTLRHLTLYLGLLQWDRFPEQLTSLSTLDISGDQLSRSTEPFFDLLRQNATTLETLAFRVKINHPPRTLPTETDELPLLTDLTLSFPHDAEFMTAFFHRFSFPSLCTLAIANNPSGIAFSRLVTPGGPEMTSNPNPVSFLTSLTLSSSASHAYDLVIFIQHATSLTSLSITRSGPETNELIEALADPGYVPRKVGSSSVPCVGSAPLLSLLRAPERKEGMLCPGLTHIKLENCSDVKTGALQRLVRSRLPPLPSSNVDPLPGSDGDAAVKEAVVSIAKIQELVVDGCAGIDARIIPWFRENVEVFSCVYMSKKESRYRR